MHLRDLFALGRGAHSGQRHGPRIAIFYLCALSVIVGALIVLSCSDGDNDNERRFSADLTGSQEVPPRTTGASGSVSLTLSSDHARITYVVTTVGPFTSNVRFAHI